MSILNTAADVLRCFGPDCTALTVMSTVEKLGIPKSNASRLLRAMRDAGLLETIGDSKQFRPSVLLLDVASTYRQSSSLIQRASEVVADISRDTGHTGYVSKLIGTEVTAITDHPGTRALRVVSNIGRRLPAYASSTGRALLARLSNDEVKALFCNGLQPLSEHSPTDLDDLCKRLDGVRQSGISFASQESTLGVDGLAVAVGEVGTAEAVSLCIVFPSATVELSERKLIEAQLLAGAAEIASITGDPLCLNGPANSKL